MNENETTSASGKVMPNRNPGGSYVGELHERDYGAHIHLLEEWNEVPFVWGDATVTHYVNGESKVEQTFTTGTGEQRHWVSLTAYYRTLGEGDLLELTVHEDLGGRGDQVLVRREDAARAHEAGRQVVMPVERKDDLPDTIDPLAGLGEYPDSEPEGLERDEFAQQTIETCPDCREDESGGGCVCEPGEDDEDEEEAPMAARLGKGYWMVLTAEEREHLLSVLGDWYDNAHEDESIVGPEDEHFISRYGDFMPAVDRIIDALHHAGPCIGCGTEKRDRRDADRSKVYCVDCLARFAHDDALQKGE